MRRLYPTAIRGDAHAAGASPSREASPLSRDRDPTTLATLAGALQAHASTGAPDDRRRAIRALGMLPCTEGLDALTDAARDPDRRTAVIALRALGDRADRRAGDLLAHLAESGDADIRTAAVQALGGLCDASRLPLLERLARADDRDLGRAAATAAARVRYGAGSDPRSGPSGGFRMADVVRDGATPAAFISLETALASIPEDRPYDEPEITRIIAAGSWDYSSVRRYLVEEGVLARSAGLYCLTDFGRTAWRVERRIAAA